MYGDQLQQTGQMSLNKAIFSKTGTYNNMAMRPYETNFNNTNIIDQFKEATMGGTNFGTNAIGGIAEHFIKPKAQTNQGIGIENGWGQSRFRFILDVSMVDTLGRNITRKIVQGYTDTDQAQIGQNGNVLVDPNLRLFFNNVITLRESTAQGPTGPITQVSIAESSHILRGDFTPSLNQGQSNMTFTMTPQNVFRNMSKMYMSGSPEMYMNGNDEVYDTRTSFGMYPVTKSRRSNGSASSYLSRILTGYKQGVDTETPYDSLDEVEAIRRASGSVQENIVTQDDFLMLMLSNTSGFGDHGSVSYSEICSSIPNLDQVATFILDTNVQRNYNQTHLEAHTAGQTEHWNGSGNETLWATALSNSVPSIMMDLMITKISFMSTNRIVGGMDKFETKIPWALSFVENLDISPYLEMFITRLHLEVLEGLSQNNLIDFTLEGHIDIAGETRLKISIGGQPAIEYATPSFCDSLFSPVLTNDNSTMDKVGYDLITLVNELNSDTQYVNQPMNTSWNSAI